jgi:hypothetical protein
VRRQIQQFHWLIDNEPKRAKRKAERGQGDKGLGLKSMQGCRNGAEHLQPRTESGNRTTIATRTPRPLVKDECVFDTRCFPIPHYLRFRSEPTLAELVDACISRTMGSMTSIGSGVGTCTTELV